MPDEKDVDWVVVQLALEHRLFRSSGDKFQDFFSDLMEEIHGDDFIRVKPHGKLGDMKIDGCFFANDTVYQCYGADDGKVLRPTDVVKKMKDDFEGALLHTPSMKEWRFTHNLMSGIPTVMLHALQEIKADAQIRGIKVSQFSRASFMDLSEKLDARARRRILGTEAVAKDRMSKLPEAVTAIIDEVMEKAPTFVLPADAPVAISPRKLTHNDISFTWQRLLKMGFEYGPIVYGCIARHGNPDAATSAPSYFKTLYESFDADGLDPDTILRLIHVELCGERPNVDELRTHAALGVMASMFESCEIFRDAPEDAAETLAHDSAE